MKSLLTKISVLARSSCKRSVVPRSVGGVLQEGDVLLHTVPWAPSSEKSVLASA